MRLKLSNWPKRYKAVSTAERNLLLEVARLITCMWLSAEDHITIAKLIVAVQSEQK